MEEPCHRGVPLGRWAEQLEHEDWDRRAEAMDALAAIGRPALPVLVRILSVEFEQDDEDDGEPEETLPAEEIDEREFVHPAAAEAAEVLARIDVEAEEVLPILLQSLESVDGVVRMWAANALGGLGAAAGRSVGRLADLLTDKEMVAAQAAEALADIGPAAREAVPALSRALLRARPTVRLWAAKALGRIGPEAASALAQLQKARERGGADLRQAADEAIERIRAGGAG